MKSQNLCSDVFAVLSLALFPLVFFWPIALGQKVFLGDDITSLFFPLRMELSRALMEGRLPLWTMYLQSGYPIFAEGHVAALDPFNLILYALLPVELAFSYSILLRLVWTSVGMYLFCRSAGLRVPSAFLAGFAFGLSGYTHAHIQHLTLQAVASWLPWLLFFQNRMQSTRRDASPTWTVWFFLTTISIAIQFVSGFPQVAIINLIPFGLISIVGVAFWNRPENTTARVIARSILESLGITALSVLLGAGIAAVQLLPAAELLNLSVRAQEMGVDFFTTYSMKPEVLTQFISPFWQLGKPDTFNQEYWAYLGVMPVMLAFFALLQRDARTRFFFLLALGAVVLALGGFTPVYGLLYYLPVFNRFRVPARFLLMLTFAMLFLSARGFEELQNRTRDSNKVTRWAVLMGFVFASLLGSILVARDSLPAGFWLTIWSWLPWVLLLFAAGSLVLALCGINRTVFVTLVLGLVVMDLVIFSLPFVTTLNPLGSPSDLTQPSRPVMAMDSTQTMYRIFTTIYNESLRPNRPVVNGKQSVQIYSPLGLQRNEDYLFIMSPAMLNLLNVRYYTRISYPRPEDEALWGYSFALDLLRERADILPTRAAQIEMVSYADNIANVPEGFVVGEIVLGAADGASAVVPIRAGIDTADWAYEGLTATRVKHSKPANNVAFPAFLPSVGKSFNGRKYVARQTLATPLDVTSVSARSNLTAGQLFIERVLLIDESGHAVSLASLAHKNELDLEFKSHAVALFENCDVMPRAFIVHQAAIVDDDLALAQMRRLDFRPDQIVLLSEEQPLTQASDSPALDQVSITDYQSERAVIRSKTDQPGYLILADSFYPGWEVRIDGHPAPIYRADYAFRAVALQAGEHTIVFEFHPFSITVGAIVSGLSLVLCTVWTVLGYRKSNSHISRDPGNQN